MKKQRVTIRNNSGSNTGKTRDDHTNKLYDVLFRHDGNTMVLFKGLERCKANSRIEALKHMYFDWRGDLFKVRSNLTQIRNASKPRHKERN
jgi:hypothetical protein